MAKVAVSVPLGTRDFGPDVVRKRNFIFHTIRSVFELYGFEPLETPAMENIETLMGKYGEEGDKLIFKILNNGLDNPEKEKQIREDFEKVLQGKNIKGITERALKYDLTIPFARYVAMNHAKLTFPFKRYQIQPVWRADRPQKGRYREFYQCDADVVGSNALLNEVELILMIDKVYSNLSNHFSEKEENHITININNRKVWAGIAELCGCIDKITDITVALDKFDKIGLAGVKKELILKGFHEEQTETIFSCLFPEDSFFWEHDEDYINGLGLSKEEKNLVLTLFDFPDKKLFAIVTCLLWNFKDKNIEIGTSGVKEIMKVIYPFCMDVDSFSLQSSFINIDSTLARGLNYYTGTIIEVKGPTSVKMGSIGGGGRYDDLTGLFGVPNIPGVGISFGVDRIYDVMEELKLFPETVHSGTQVLFFNLGEKESHAAFQLAQQLRQKGIRCELYHENSKFDKQFKYAEKKNIPYVVIIGEEELKAGNSKLKNIRTGEQQTLSIGELINTTFI